MVYEQLRIALTEAYISILHGLYEEDQNNRQHFTAENEMQVESFATQMFQYLEALVANKSMNFPQELLKPMFELYCDIATMYV